MDQPAGLAEQLVAALRPLLPGVVAVDGLKRLTGGSSHDTWAFDARMAAAGEGERPLPLILRREFAAPLFEMSLETEFALLRQLSEQGLQVPMPLACLHLDGPAMVMERVDGVDARKLMAQPLMPGSARSLGHAIVAEQVRIHEAGTRPLDAVLQRSAHDTFTAELGRWGAMIDAAKVASPALIIARDWLVQHYPGPPTRSVIVHGDYKANNILMRGGQQPIVIDWELAHVGDRHEDLAWTMAWTSPYDIVGGMMTRDDYIATYAAISGQRVDPDRLRFWQMFSLVKLAAIFLKGIEPRLHGEPLQPLHLMLGQAVPRLEMAIFDLLLAGENG